LAARLPPSRVDPVRCLSSAKVLEACRYVDSSKPDRLELFYRQLSRRDTGVDSANFDRLVCPFLPICDPIVNNQIVKWDTSHLTNAFAASIAPAVDTYLKQVGALPR